MRSATLLCITLLLPVSFAFAQSGKIAGTVTDAASGEPLPGVNVVIEGTTQGATTNVEGAYTILNVRPGEYALRASFVGYADQVVQGVGVNIDLTTEVDIALQEETFGLDEVTVTATAPIIQRDLSGSQRNINSVEILEGRYQRINDVLRSQVSVGAVGAYNDRPEIRGSNLEESKFIVDGVEQNDALTNRPYTSVNLDAVEEVQVLTGGFSAEYGDLRSGVVNVVTKSGGEQYSGSANVQYSRPGLKHFGPMPYGHESSVVRPFADPMMAFQENDFFDGWVDEAADPSRDPQHQGSPGELYALWLWRHRSQDSIDKLREIQERGMVEGPNGAEYPVNVQFADGVDADEFVFHETGDMPDYNASFTFGGPVPLLEPVKFFLSYDQSQTEYVSAFPEPAFTDRNFRAKLTTNLTPETRLDVSGFFGRVRGGDGGQGTGLTGFIASNPYRSLGGSNKFWYSHCAVPAQQSRQIYNAQLTHTFNTNTFAELSFSHNRVDYEMLNDVRETLPIAAVEGQTSALQGLLGTDADLDANGGRDYALIKIGDQWYDEAPNGYSPVWWVDVTGYYRMSSCNVRYNETNTRTYDFTGSMTSQIGQHNLVKAGFQFGQEQIYQDYRALDPSVNGGSVQISDVDQYNLALYAQDKLEYEGFVANLGLRLEGWILGEFPVLGGEGEGGPYSSALLAGNTTTVDENGEVVYALQELAPQERVAHWRLSPRLGISHPITNAAKVFFNYGHMYQLANASQLYNIQYNTRQGNRIGSIGNPRLAPPRTIMYELGYEHNLFNAALLRLTGYYKDVNAEVDGASFQPLGQPGYGRNLNQEFEDIRGFEFFTELQRDVLPFVSGFASLNWLVKSEGKYGNNVFFEDPVQQPRPENTQVSEPDVRPIFKTSLSFNTPEDFGPDAAGFSLFGGISANVLYTWQRGRQFTWNPAGIALVDNNLRWSNYQRWDLRITKELVSQGSVRASLYFDVTNLFNQRNLQFWSGNEDVFNRAYFTWDGQKWFNDTIENYMFSLGYTDENQNEDGSFNTEYEPGDWEDRDIDVNGDGDVDELQLPPWSSFRFFEPRDVYFGIRFTF